MEVAGSKAQAGAGIQALLQTDLNTSRLQRAIMDNGKDRHTAWPAMAEDWDSMVRAGPGRPWLPGKPSTSVCSWNKQLGGGWGPGVRSGLSQTPHVILGTQPWTLGAQPSTQHQASQAAGGICGSQGTAPMFRSPQIPSSLPCPRPGATSQQRC